MTTIGRPRSVVDALPAYRPGKAAHQAEAEHGITGAIKLASNENPEPPLEAIVDAVCVAARQINRYGDHRALAVRGALAARLGVDVAQVAVGNGTVGLLQQLCLSYLDPGDEVVFPWRSFEVYPVYTQLAGATAVTVPVNPDLTFNPDRLVAAVTRRTKLMFLATPNNPTGVALTTDQLASILERVPSDVVVCVDEAYREFLNPAFGDPVADLVPRFPNLVVTRTLSKAHGLAGLRCGYAVGHPELVSTLDKTLVPFAVNSLAQAAALAALEHSEVIDAAVARLIGERTRVERHLVDQGWSLPDHQANFVWLATGERTEQVATDLERRGVVVRPFADDGIRITVGTPEENDRFLEQLAEVANP